MADEDETVHYDGAEGGWGSIRGIVETAWRERTTPAALNTLRRQNKDASKTPAAKGVPVRIVV